MSRVQKTRHLVGFAADQGGSPIIMGYRGEQEKMSVESEPIDPYAVVLADLRAKRSQIDQAIQAIESLRGISPAPASSTEGTSKPQATNDDTGAYLGMTIADATRKLLGAKKRAMSTADIVVGITAGGLALSSADPINTVSAVLGRRSDKVGDIVRPNRGLWGLKEWYPNRSFKKERETTKGEVTTEETEGGEASETTGFGS